MKCITCKHEEKFHREGIRGSTKRVNWCCYVTEHNKDGSQKSFCQCNAYATSKNT